MTTGDDVHAELSGGTYTWCVVRVPMAARELLNYAIPVGGFTAVHTTPDVMLAEYEQGTGERHMMLVHDDVRAHGGGLTLSRRWARVYRTGHASGPGEDFAPWVAPHFNDGRPVAPLFRTLLLAAFWKGTASGVLTYEQTDTED